MNRSIASRRNLSGTTGLLAVPNERFFDQVSVLVNDRPREKRFIAFTCRESYQVLPSGAQ